MNTPDYTSWIGTKVAKFSKASSQIHPFKSGLRVNTVKGIAPHKELSKLKKETVWAFTFEEDDSYVACYKCEFIEQEIVT